MGSGEELGVRLGEPLRGSDGRLVPRPVGQQPGRFLPFEGFALGDGGEDGGPPTRSRSAEMISFGYMITPSWISPVLRSATSQWMAAVSPYLVVVLTTPIGRSSSRCPFTCSALTLTYVSGAANLLIGASCPVCSVAGAGAWARVGDVCWGVGGGQGVYCGYC